MSTKATLSEEVIRIGKSIAEKLDVDNDTGIVTDTDEKGSYKSHRPAILTDEIEKVRNDYLTTYVAANTYAMGIVSHKAFTDNNKLNRCSGSFSVGHKDTLEVVIDKSDKSEYTVHGSLDIRASKNSGQFKAVTNAIKEMGANALLNK